MDKCITITQWEGLIFKNKMPHEGTGHFLKNYLLFIRTNHLS
jgi:hypothetical protein